MNTLRSSNYKVNCVSFCINDDYCLKSHFVREKNGNNLVVYSFKRQKKEKYSHMYIKANARSFKIRYESKFHYKLYFPEMG